MHLNNATLVSKSLPVSVQMGLYKYTHMWLEVIMWWITRVDERLAPSLSAVRVCMFMQSLKNHESTLSFFFFFRQLTFNAASQDYIIIGIR